MDEQKKCPWLTIGTPQCGILLGIVGVVIAFMLLFLGFWRTLFVAVLFGVGYFMGVNTHKTETIKTVINKLIPPKGE